MSGLELIAMDKTLEYASSHTTIADAQTSPIVVVLSAEKSQKLNPTDATRDTITARSGAGTHKAEEAAPGGLENPAAHAMQDSSEVEPMISLYVPAPQALHAEDKKPSTSLKRPAGQGLHAVPSMFDALPIAQV